MGPPEQRAADRTSYYTMKTAAGLPPPGASHTPAGSHSRSNSQSFFYNKQTDTPLASPRAPHSVGQPQAPKLSPSAHRGLAQDARTPSPNYFGLAIEPSADPRDSSLMPRENWSSPTSSVKSFGAAIPKQLPLDANPEFEAFRRQVDVHRGKLGFNLSTSHFNIPNGPVAHTPLASTPSALQRPRPPRWHTHASDGGDGPRASGSLGGMLRARDAAGTKSNAETDSLQDSAYGSADSKRNSEASLNPPPMFGLRTHESPAQLELPFPAPAPDRGRPNFSLNILDRPRSGLTPVPGRTGSACSAGAASHRQTPSPALEPGDPKMMSPDQLRDLLTTGSDANVLILDLRVSPQYAASRVKGALNLCIPTTLLKRSTFNLQKLQQTFQAENDQEKFAHWRDTTHLVVYDAQSSDRRDAVSALNMVKKFANEGYSGSANILRGGFNAFAAAYPDLVDRTSGRSSPGLSFGGGPAAPHPHVAPVIGGVMLPTMTSNPNPFFSNIRQNQDLVDGVGQMDVSLPSNVNSSRLPRWLGEAAEASDHGKKVSDKFLRIELREQSRMKEAYCVQSHQGTGTSTQHETKVQLSGIEQGVKNRYKDILPFEHARVKLAGRPEGTCDYVNASHLRANRSYKRYIASQGPLPATFEVGLFSFSFL
jgi:tyrosine-protein phosphatase 2/3